MKNGKNFKQEEAYRPILCSFYDLLEADATLRKISLIQFQHPDLGACTVKGIIEDIYIKGQAEYLCLSDGTEIRLDTLLSFNGTPLPSEGQGYC